MAGSGRASPFLGQQNTEAAVQSQMVRQDAAAAMPGSPGTAEVLTEEIVHPYRFRVEDLNAQEIKWFSEKIKMFHSVDTTDKPGGSNDNNSTAQNSIEAPTNSFGKILFQGEASKGVLPSWYVRLAVNTSEELIQEMLEEKFEVMNSRSHPLRFHCIDYNPWPSDQSLPYYQEPISSKEDLDAVTTKLQRDLFSMCKKTAGVVLTWSGLGSSNIMHSVLGGIVDESRQRERHVFNLASIATPPWNAVIGKIWEDLQVKGGDVPVPVPEDDAGELPEERPSLGGHISQYATHFLMLDDDKATNDLALSSDKEKSNFRHFHYEMIKAMENSDKKTKEIPVVCVLINGHHDALKMVVFALSREIPVLIVKGSGGYADVIADVYLHAKDETIKNRDERDHQVRTRMTKRPGKRGQFYMDQKATNHRLLKEIFDKLDLLTVYVPSLSVQGLDSVVFEALLKHKQEVKFGKLVEVMQKTKKSQRCMTSFTENRSFIDSDPVQMDYFIEAVKQNSVDLVKMFLDRLNISSKLMHHFHMGRILRLYNQNTGEQERLIDFRSRFVQLLKKLTVIPLRCVCKGCPNCDTSISTKSKVSELAVERTCLHPLQELFLWTLHDRHVEMAIVFWKRCEDKIAAALVARKVFKSMAKESTDPDFKWQMEENVGQFQNLAIQTVRSCHSMDEVKTELLLTKPCVWWGNLSVLQLAIITENREFMTQTACRNIMTRIWFGKPLRSDRITPQRPCQLVNIPSDTRCTRWHRCSPFLQYLANFVMQVLFLGLFSYGLLFDMGHGTSPIFFILVTCVAAITLEEVRQLVSKHSVLRDSHLETSGITKTKLYTYLIQGWNIIDLVTVLLFWLGMVVLAPVHSLQVLGRVLLSIDVFFFFMRTFQMLMVFEELGLLLVMVYKMGKDTRNFMIILLIFVLAYSVASESLLYPKSDFNFARLFHLPRKAYWQVFGELGLEEIEIREMGSCSVNKSKHFGYDDPHCPTEYGSYLSPVFLGIYVMITNVLLLNLLIARFGVTFNKVHDEAREYQSWHRCEIITEYYNRTSLPPPFNILHFFYYFAVKTCIKIHRCCIWLRCCCCCCFRRQERPRSGAGSNYQMTAVGKGGGNNAGSGGQTTSAGTSGQQNPLMTEESKVPVTGRRSASRRSVDIFWTNRLSLKRPNQQSGQESGQGSDQGSDQGSGQASGQKSDQGSGQQSSDQPAEEAYTVEVNVSSGGGQSPSRSVKYKVGRKDPESGEMKQAFTIWDWNPNAEYKVTVEDAPVNLEQTESSISPEYLREVVEFEDNQAEWVCHPRDSNIAWLDGLQAQTETLQQEIGRMGAELKENHVTLKDDIRKADDRMGQQVDSVQEMTKYCKQSKSVFEKIDGNMEKLNTFIQDDFARIAEEMKTTKKNLQTVKEEKKDAEKKKTAADEKRKEAEEKRKDAERALEEMKKNWTQEKERMQAEIRQAREKHELELQRAVQAVREEQQGVVRDMLQQQETLQREQHLAMQQMQQVLQQVGQGVSATRPASGVGESGDTQ